jgi:transcription elongation factor GreB
MTAEGSERLRAELSLLIERDRPALAALPSDDPETKRRRQMLDQRVDYLQESLRTAEVPAGQPEAGRVNFGATVAVRDSQGNESTYRLVGVDETDLGQNWVSWQAPIAKALWNARVGQRVPFKFPSGRTELEIVRVDYAQVR